MVGGWREINSNSWTPNFFLRLTDSPIFVGIICIMLFLLTLTLLILPSQSFLSSSPPSHLFKSTYRSPVVLKSSSTDSLAKTGRNKFIVTQGDDKLMFDVYRPNDKDTGECVLCEFWRPKK